MCLHHLGLMSTADMERKAHSAKDYMFRQVAHSVPAENKAVFGKSQYIKAETDQEAEVGAETRTLLIQG